MSIIARGWAGGPGVRPVRVLLLVVLIWAFPAFAGTPGYAQSSPPASVDEPANTEGEAAPAAHDPSTPPIECPLHGKGVDHDHLRPFEEVEEYIAFLDSPERAAWQKPDEVVAALGLEGTETVVDLGAGSGYFTFRMAAKLPGGRVIAAEIEPEMVRHIHHKVVTEGLKNVEARLIGPEDPALPAGVDLVFLCDVLHHVPERAAWLDKLCGDMGSGARLALIEFREGELPKGPPPAMKIPRKELLRLLTEAGLVLVSDKSDILPYQYLLIFEKP